MIQEKTIAHELAGLSSSAGKDWNPVFFDLKKEENEENFRQLLSEKRPICTDEIKSQLAELIKSRNPKRRLSAEEVQTQIASHTKGVDLVAYGVWVYYPWSNRLVHLLDENEFIEVRTNRNHYKISPAEEKVLSAKKVGLIGLSVGQSVAVTMAMERGFGELRLADFDDLELTNLNRIRTGVHNLGLSKTISVAREIMEIDPYLKLKCFTDGLTEENIDAFFTEGGTLDLLIDECDGLDMKLISRWKAKELRIPVVMEASDKGMVDVERFDLEPDRPILHGLIQGLDPAKLRTLETNEDKIPYMLDIVGLDTISVRAQASMLEIGETITTWPQLASAVTLGGGITADVVRRIFLNQYTESGRYYVDVEELIGNRKNGETGAPKLSVPSPSDDFGPGLDSSGKTLEPKLIKNIVEAACHAPSGGNLQPWKWSHSGNQLQLKQDSKLISSFLDYNYIASMIALGASIENARLAGIGAGLEASISYFPIETDPEVIAKISLHSGTGFSDDDVFLAQNIFNRETNRNIEAGPLLSPDESTFLKRIGSRHDSELILLDKGDDFNTIAECIAFAERFRIMHPTGHRNFNEEMRWTREDAEETRDGIDVRTVDLTVGELAGFKLARHRPVIDKLIEWKGGTAFEKLSRKATNSAAALGIITREKHSRLDHVKAGMDMERVWIGANARGIGFQPQSPLTLIMQRLKDSADLTPKQREELLSVATRYQEVIKKYTQNEPVFMFRLFHGKKKVVRSLRRDINLHFRSA